MQRFRIVNGQTGSVLGSEVLCADTWWTRLVGLMGKSCLRRGSGLWIYPCRAIHTFGMQFPIDALGVDDNFVVVEIWQGIKPNRIPSFNPRVSSVVEFTAGQIASCTLSIGDRPSHF